MHGLYMCIPSELQCVVCDNSVFWDMIDVEADVDETMSAFA